MRVEVLKHVSVGMPMAEAKKIMERNGFNCRFDDTWSIATPDVKTKYLIAHASSSRICCATSYSLGMKSTFTCRSNLEKLQRSEVRHKSTCL